MSEINVVLFCYLVQTVLMVYVGLALFNIRLSRTDYVSCGILMALGVWLVRSVYMQQGIPLGSHTLVLTVFFILVLNSMGHQSWGISIGATLASMTLVVFGDGFSQIVVSPFLGMTFEQILGNPRLHIFMGLVEDTFLILAMIFNKAFGFTIVKLLDVE